MPANLVPAPAGPGQATAAVMPATQVPHRELLGWGRVAGLAGRAG